MGNLSIVGENVCTGNCADCTVANVLVEPRDHRAEAKARFPEWTQPLVTRFMCKPTVEEICNLENANPVDRVVENVLLLTVSTAAVATAASTFTVFSIPVAVAGMLVSVGVLRDFQLSISHEASHHSFFSMDDKKKLGKKWKFLNELVLEFATTISLSANGKDYRGEHQPHHAVPVFMTRDDPDAALLLKLGFKPGMSVRQLWWHLLRTSFSPAYHARYLCARIRSNVITAKKWRRLAGMTWLGALVGVATLIPFSVWFFAVFMVWVPLWQISALLQFCSEHPWLSHEGSVQSKQEYAEGCHARFSWAPLPPKELKGFAKVKEWTKWAARMLFVELPVRVAVVPSVLSGHDAHHLSVWSNYDLSDWPNTIYHREKMIREQGDQFGMSKREFYGIHNAVNHVFGALSRAPLA